MWDTIKKILQKQEGACIIIEDGKPEYVVTRFSDYEKFLEKKEEIAAKNFNSNFAEEELLDRINQEIASWKAVQQEQQAEAEITEKTIDEEVKIEDLPLS